MEDEFDEEPDPGNGYECDDCKAQLTFDDGQHGCAEKKCIYDDSNLEEEK